MFFTIQSIQFKGFFSNFLETNSPVVLFVGIRMNLISGPLCLVLFSDLQIIYILTKHEQEREIYLEHQVPDRLIHVKTAKHLS